jgi:glycosyltransferase involved in cell wall biosynthesis
MRMNERPKSRLRSKRVAMVVFSGYPSDPRPRRAAEALASQGMEVDLICLATDDNELKREVSNGIRIRRIPVPRSRGSVFTYLFEYGAFLLASGLILAVRSLTRRYDLVYVHNMPDILVFSAFVPKLFGAKVILDLHDPMPELMTTIYGLEPQSLGVRVLQRFERRSIAFADAVVTVNRACANLFTSRSCPSKKMNVVMNLPDEQIFSLRSPQIGNSPSSDSTKPFVIMYHGSLVERNGLDLAVEALAEVRKSIPNAQLRIYGWKNAFLERVMRLVEEKELQEAVIYLGPKSLEQLVEVIEECDLGVIPNRVSIFTELNTPTRIFEYLALGKPAIAPRAPGIVDYFDDASLFLFKLGSAEDLARSIEYVFSHPAEVVNIVKRGQEVCRERSWSKERLRLISLVSALLLPSIGTTEAAPTCGLAEDCMSLASKTESSGSEPASHSNTRITDRATASSSNWPAAHSKSER